MKKIIQTSIAALAFITLQNVEGDPSIADAYESIDLRQAPVAPKAPPAPVAPEAPSAPQAPGSINSVKQSHKEPLNINKFMTEVRNYKKESNDVDTNLETFINKNGIRQTANIVKLYLAGNLEKIREGINASKNYLGDLQKQLNNNLNNLNRSNSVLAKEFVPLFEKLANLLEHLKQAADTYSSKTEGNKKFSELKQSIDSLAIDYFNQILNAGDLLKSAPGLSAIRNSETVLICAIRLANALSDLEYFAAQSRNTSVDEKTVKIAISLMDLKRLISQRIDAINTESAKNSVTLPTGKIVSEQDLLSLSFALIDDNRLEDLLKLRDILIKTYTIISYAVPTDGSNDPIKLICNLSDDIVNARGLLDQSKKIIGGHDSQFGKLFSDGGSAVIPSMNPLVAAAGSVDYTDQNQSMRDLVSGKILTGEIAKVLVNLYNEGTVLSFNKTVSNLIMSNTKISAYSYTSITKKAETAKGEKSSAFIVLNGDTKIGTAADPERLKNSMALSQLQKNCENYVKELARANNDIGEIEGDISKINHLFGAYEGDRVNYLNNILNNYFVFGGQVEVKDGQVSLKSKSKLLGIGDIPAIVFALAQNCDVLVNSPLPLLPTSKNIDKAWILTLAENVSTVIGQTINAINKLSDQESLAEPLKKLKNSIDEAVARAKAPATESAAAPAEASTEATESAAAPAEASTEATESAAAPAEAATAATELTTKVAEAATEATESAAASAETTTEATESAVSPAETSTEATGSTTEVAETTTEATGSTTEVAETTTEATESAATTAETSTEATAPAVSPAETSTEATGSTTEVAGTTPEVTESAAMSADIGTVSAEKKTTARSEINKSVDNIAKEGSDNTKPTEKGAFVKETATASEELTSGTEAEKKTISHSQTGGNVGDSAKSGDSTKPAEERILTTREKRLSSTARSSSSFDDEEGINSEESEEEKTRRRNIRARRTGGRVADLLKKYEDINMEAQKKDALGQTQRGYGSSRLSKPYGADSTSRQRNFR